MMVISMMIGMLCTVTKGSVQGLEDLEKKQMSRDNPNFNIFGIGPNTKKSPGDLRGLLSLKPQWKTIS